MIKVLQDFLQALPHVHQGLKGWQRRPEAERLELFKLWIEGAQLSNEFKVAALQSLQQLSELSLGKDRSYQPYGVVHMEFPLLELDSFLMWVFPALAKGNGVFVKTQEVNAFTEELMLAREGSPWGQLLQWVHPDNKDSDFLYEHPVFKAYWFTGDSLRQKDVRRKVLLEKNLPFFSEGAGRGVAFVVGPLLDKTWLHALFAATVDPTLNYKDRPSRIFVLDSLFEDFCEQYRTWLGEHGPHSWPVQNTKEWDFNHRLFFQEGCATLFEKELVPLNSLGETNALSQDVPLRLFVKKDFSNCSPLQQLEVNGPLVTLTRAKYPHEAIKFINTTRMARSASIWGSDEAKMEKNAALMEAGVVGMNQVPQVNLALSPTSSKDSWLGFDGYPLGFLFTQKTQLLK